MSEQLGQFLTDAWLNFRVADVLDIAFVSVALYFLLSWVRRRASAAVAAGAVVLLGAYAVAEIFDLYMSSFLFKVGLTVLVFAFLLVFQDDVRRVFEQLRLRATRGRGDGTSDDKYLDAVVEATTRMAEDSVGALIVLEGDEAIDVHTHGGVSVGGEPTVPLLLSLFQPNSPAHDGAVTIKGGRLQKFGVHLPLSTDDDQIGSGGTRHAAALGLAERCDATIVVVSEERGTVSVARDGRLEQLQSTSELKTHLEQLYEDDGDAGRSWSWSRLVHENAGLKAISIAAAALLWITFASRISTTQSTVSVPIEYRNVPETLALEKDAPTEARVQLIGTQRAFDRLDSEELAISIDLGDRGPGEARYILSGSDLALPRELSVATIEPMEIDVELFELAPASLPVSVSTRGSLPPDLDLESLSARPPEVDVYVRKTYRDRIEKVATEPIDLSQIRESTSLEVAVTPSRHTRWRHGFEGAVTVEIEVRAQANLDADALPADADQD